MFCFSHQCSMSPYSWTNFSPTNFNPLSSSVRLAHWPVSPWKDMGLLPCGACINMAFDFRLIEFQISPCWFRGPWHVNNAVIAPDALLPHPLSLFNRLAKIVNVMICLPTICRAVKACWIWKVRAFYRSGTYYLTCRVIVLEIFLLNCSIFGVCVR